MKHTLLLLTIFLMACETPPPMEPIAERYVKLVLAIGNYDSDMVDAYYGPKEWRAPKAAEAFPHAEMKAEAQTLLEMLAGQKPQGEMESQRVTFLSKQLAALAYRIDFLNGEKRSFNEETTAAYDATHNAKPESYYAEIAEELSKKLGGEGSLSDRLAAFKKDFIIPKEKLDTVFQAAIAEARKRTLAHIELPENENFTVEYVTDKAWSGYNWYKGNSYSLIQLNTDFPIYIDRAIDLACHEGYPGHHVFNALLEKNLMRKNNWMEYSVYPLFSPQSLIAEGSANFGIDVAFTKAERFAFERDVLFPLAGLDANRVEEYYAVLELVGKLAFSGNEAARDYLDGKISKENAVNWLVKYALNTKARAEQRIKFIEKYRSYVINYNVGKQIVREYVERHGGTDENPAKRWELFEYILSHPLTASALK